ncbi:hypothetical protein A8U91_02546 [Halomonas elongata]|uniref:Uncharacterized protein n=1 Tax=Halomonas elongata TaxID=2746 RepID=A0A1B8P7G4_HALEL|nr:hypothetical protein A8U91_02546 [Halomonas elongata]
MTSKDVPLNPCSAKVISAAPRSSAPRLYDSRNDGVAYARRLIDSLGSRPGYHVPSRTNRTRRHREYSLILMTLGIGNGHTRGMKRSTGYRCPFVASSRSEFADENYPRKRSTTPRSLGKEMACWGNPAHRSGRAMWRPASALPRPEPARLRHPAWREDHHHSDIKAPSTPPDQLQTGMSESCCQLGMARRATAATPRSTRVPTPKETVAAHKGAPNHAPGRR